MTVSIRAGAPSELDTIVAIDDDTAPLFAQAGIRLVLPPGHPYTVSERTRWRRSLEAGNTFLAVDSGAGADAGAGASVVVGFAVLELLDGAPYLEQLSVRLASMRQGTGRALLNKAVAWARERRDSLWLTTYAHLPWNRPFYEKEGFVVVPHSDWGAEISARNAEERQVLPAPDQRIIMRRRLISA
jgi:GNAT superfamily N-acetyltransferase